MYMNRREFLRTAGGAAGATAAIGASQPAAAAEDGGGSAPEPDYGGWFSDVSNFSETVDERGSDEVTVAVGSEGNGGNYAFGPAAVHVDPGTTIVWEWTGKGQSHNVLSEGGDFEGSELTAEAGFTFEHTFEEDGMYKYYCEPHRPLGMKGAILVGTDYPSAGGDGGGQATPINPEHMGVPFQAHFVGLATILAMMVSLVFTFFLLKYGTSAHAKGGND